MLVVSDLEVSFGKIRALNGVNFSVNGPEIVTLIGANGAGKTTTLRAIAGLIKPRRGSILLESDDVAGRTPAKVVAAGITLVPQGRQLFGSMTVRENIQLGGFLHGKGADVEEDLQRWMEFFPEIRPRLHLKAASLSGGEQQIVALIRGLMARPRLLMLDEPSIGVAPMVVKRIGEELIRLCRDAHVPIVLVEQNIAFAFDIADRVVILAQGRDVHVAPPDELREPDVLAKYFFGDVAISRP